MTFATPKILYLPTAEPWFSMISSGEKTEEYRDLTPYWRARLCKIDPYGDVDRFDRFKHFDFVEFRNGYGFARPMFQRPMIEITIGKGRVAWGANPIKKQFIIKLA